MYVFDCHDNHEYKQINQSNKKTRKEYKSNQSNCFVTQIDDKRQHVKNETRQIKKKRSKVLDKCIHQKIREFQEFSNINLKTKICICN